jgi:hypothetical protein
MPHLLIAQGAFTGQFFIRKRDHLTHLHVVQLLGQIFNLFSCGLRSLQAERVGSRLGRLHRHQLFPVDYHFSRRYDVHIDFQW